MQRCFCVSSELLSLHPGTQDAFQEDPTTITVDLGAIYKASPPTDAGRCRCERGKLHWCEEKHGPSLVAFLVKKNKTHHLHKLG